MPSIIPVIIALGQFIWAHGLELVGAFVLVCNSLIGFFMLIPGEQPEKALQKVVDFVGKYSKKPSA